MSDTQISANQCGPLGKFKASSIDFEVVKVVQQYISGQQ